MTIVLAAGRLVRGVSHTSELFAPLLRQGTCVQPHPAASTAATERASKMVLKLYRADPSPPVRASMMVLDILQLPVEFVKVNLAAGDNYKQEFLNLNPLHTVPVLEDGNFVLHDSHAIITYLVDEHATTDELYPRERRQRALVDQKLFFNAAVLFPRLRCAAAPVLFGGARSVPEPVLAAIEESYQFTEQFLSRSRYLALEQLTLADIAAYATLTTSAHFVPIAADRYPKVAEWMSELERQPYAQRWNARGAAMFGKVISMQLSKI